ncbi:hypothetical protein [Gemmobacter denitrificans]|uniref:SGNH/GDSL hydrolase family protein n=1 Tax=Gemmobacter denitrificans TaxID=3123040 RepID=A0ABU8C040_9RHOB
MTQRLLIIGFSNVVTTSGFAQPTIARLAETVPGLEVFRVGLGALQPQVIPPYLRLASERLGPFSHVLLEIATSAYATHPLANVAAGQEILADILLTLQEIGAEPAFLLHVRRWTRPVVLDFGGLIRQLCHELDLPLLDLAEGWIAQHGATQVAAWLRDDTHTTAEGGSVMAERLVPFLQEVLARPPVLAGLRPAPPLWRRRALDLAQMLPDCPSETHDCLDLPQDYVRLEGRGVTIDPGRVLRVQGLVHLYHAAGGHVSVTPDPPGPGLRVTMIDPLSHFTRIGVLPFDFFRGCDMRRLLVGEPEEAPEIGLVRGQQERPLRAYLGPLLTLDPTAS